MEKKKVEIKIESKTRGSSSYQSKGYVEELSASADDTLEYVAYEKIDPDHTEYQNGRKASYATYTYYLSDGIFHICDYGKHKHIVIEDGKIINTDSEEAKIKAIELAVRSDIEFYLKNDREVEEMVELINCQIEEIDVEAIAREMVKPSKKYVAPVIISTKKYVAPVITADSSAAAISSFLRNSIDSVSLMHRESKLNYKSGLRRG